MSMYDRRSRKRDVYDWIPCEVCGAALGMPCLSPNGLPGRVHSERRESAARIREYHWGVARHLGIVIDRETISQIIAKAVRETQKES